MSASYIQVATDGTGKKMQTVKNTVGSDEVHAEAVYLVDPGDQSARPVRSTTSTVTSVSNATSNVTLLSANAARIGATIFNDDSSALLRVKLGASASGTSFTVMMAPRSYFEVPFSYTGQIDAIASAASGSARISELTA